MSQSTTTGQYSKEQLHEAYTIEYYAHKQTQKMLNREIHNNASMRNYINELESRRCFISRIYDIITELKGKLWKSEK